MNQRKLFTSLTALFFCVVVYALCAMAFSREIVIPHMAKATNGHIAGDPEYYHTLAVKKAAEMRLNGLSAFELRPEGQGPAGITGLLYLLWENPYSTVLINALLHGVSAIAMLMICMQWFSFRSSIIAILPLALSPYNIVWFSQINKDTYVLAGVLLFTYGFLCLATDVKSKYQLRLRDFLPLIIAIIGISLIWLVKPYINQILLPISGLILFVVLLLQIVSWRDRHYWIRFTVSSLLVLVFLSVFGEGTRSDETLRSFDNFKFVTESKSVANKCFAKISKENWIDVPIVPELINNKIKAMMGQRCLMFTMLETQGNATTLNSFIDTNILPGNTTEAIAYLPRAALLGILSPWPDRWNYVFNHRPSVFYTIVLFETALLYVGLLSGGFWLIWSRKWSVLIPVFMSIFVMTVYGMATPFIGSLYRYRYPWWMLLICLGLATLIENLGRDKEKNNVV